MEEKLTPMMQQYLALKQELKDEVLFFRMGDFYEMFMDDAKEVSRILNITLTARNGIPMCGIPYHAAKNYLKRLLDAGKKIAVSEQVEMPDSTRSLARREVVQIITPGTVVEDEFLDAARNNFILCASLTKKEISCSYCDLSSGQFSLVVLDKDTRWESFRALYEELGPRELLIHEDDYLTDISFAREIDQMGAMKTKLPSWYFSIRHGRDLLKEQSETLSLKPFGMDDDDIALISAGALLHYLKDTAKTSLKHLTSFQRINMEVFLQIDEASRKNLEIITNLQDGTSARTLFSSVDSTRTSAGARLLKRWLSAPLAEIPAIERRQNHIQWYLDDQDELQRVRQILGNTLDIMRLTTRVAMKRAIPQDLVSIQHSLRSFFTLLGQHTAYYRELASGLEDSDLDKLVDMMDMLTNALQENCQGPFVAGEVIQNGFDVELDRLRQLRSNGSSKLHLYLENLKKETGIVAMKLSYNRIIGHYLEIPKSQEKKIPASFYRKQTLVNAERYTTEELMTFEKNLLECEQDAESLEKEIFGALMDKTESLIPQLTIVGSFFSTIDCFQSLATVANRQGYCKPEIVEDEILVIENGRHPVVEQMLPIGAFIANPLDMVDSNERFCLITGPNMAGKSTYLRQNALIVLLAQIGSFVPATHAVIGLTDKLFCRVGASDNLARGESTFLIEMQEAAFILRTASRKSLVIMDEIGRGTSTQDGMSLAYAMMQYLIGKSIKTLFATHYHELTMFDNQALQLLTLEVAESQQKIVFLRRLRKGVANSSYGLHVAKMAGIPPQVIRTAAQFQKKHFHDYTLGTDSLQLDLFRGDDSVGLFDDSITDITPASQIVEKILRFPLEDSTPMQAIRFLEELKSGIMESLS